MSSKEEVVRRWLEKARHDILNVENNFQAENIPFDTVCFHCQQAVEKCFKAVLVQLDRPVGKSHDLVYLKSMIGDYIPELQEYEEDMEALSAFAVDVRYPDSFIDPTPEQARQAYEIAVKLRDLISKKLPV